MLRLHAHVWIGPHKIERHLWHRVRPNPGVALAIRVVPQGDGGGKNPLRLFLLVAVVALSIAAPYIGGTALGLMTTTGGTTKLGAGVSAGLGGTARTCVVEAKPAHNRNSLEYGKGGKG